MTTITKEEREAIRARCEASRDPWPTQFIIASRKMFPRLLNALEAAEARAEQAEAERDVLADKLAEPGVPSRMSADNWLKYASQESCARQAQKKLEAGRKETSHER